MCACESCIIIIIIQHSHAHTSCGRITLTCFLIMTAVRHDHEHEAVCMCMLLYVEDVHVQSAMRAKEIFNDMYKKVMQYKCVSLINKVHNSILL